jgi:hypothetical protein
MINRYYFINFNQTVTKLRAPMNKSIIIFLILQLTIFFLTLNVDIIYRSIISIFFTTFTNAHIVF